MARTRRPQEKAKPRTTGPAGLGVPPKLLAKLRALCLALPEAYEEAAWVGTRWMIRKRNFAHVLKIEAGWPPAYARAAASEGPLVVLTFRTSDMLRDALRDAGPQFFLAEWGTKWGTKVVGLKLERDVDWKEVETLVVESYRLLAPKRLLATPTTRAPGRRRA
jgi:predicted DNA-binding protein (MmcQ/YjbR family)